MAKKKHYHVKKTGTYKGKSNALGHGGRAQQLRDQGMSERLIGYLARKAHAAPGQKNYHGHRGHHSAPNGSFLDSRMRKFGVN